MSVIISTSKVDAHQAWKGKLKGRAIYLSADHVWPNYTVEGYPNSLSGKGKKNAIKNYDFSGKAIGSEIEVDPAGMTINFVLLSHETSYWHFVGVQIECSNCSLSALDISGDSGTQYLTEQKIYTFDNLGQLDLSPTRENNTGDLFFTASIDENNSSSSTTGWCKLLGYYDEWQNFHNLPTPITIFSFGQQVNTSYKYHIGWLNLTTDPTSTTSIDESMFTSTKTIAYDETSPSFYLFLEVATSEDNGASWKWNDTSNDTKMGSGSLENPDSQLDVTYVKVGDYSGVTGASISNTDHPNILKVTLDVKINNATNNTTNQAVKYSIKDMTCTAGSLDNPSKPQKDSVASLEFKVNSIIGISEGKTKISISAKDNSYLQKFNVVLN